MSSANKSNKKTGNPTRTDGRIADNKKAAFNYFFEERHEAGMVLQGWEIKAIRNGKVQLTDGYIHIRDGEMFLIGCQINPLRSASTHTTTVVRGESASLFSCA